MEDWPKYYCYIILLLITLSDLAFFYKRLKDFSSSEYGSMDHRRKIKDLFFNWKTASFTFISKLLTENDKTTNISNCLRRECFWWCNEFKLQRIQFFSHFNSLYSSSIFSSLKHWHIKKIKLFGKSLRIHFISPNFSFWKDGSPDQAQGLSLTRNSINP